MSGGNYFIVVRNQDGSVDVDLRTDVPSLSRPHPMGKREALRAMRLYVEMRERVLMARAVVDELDRRKDRDQDEMELL